MKWIKSWLHFSNVQVGISFDSESYRPGQTAKINFSAAPGSKLAYSAVDKSLHLLGGENQITPDRVIKYNNYILLSADCGNAVFILNLWS